MKRAMPWSDDDEYSGSSSSDASSSSGSDAETGGKAKKGNRSNSKHRNSLGKSGRQKAGALGYEALAKHGYKGGPSVLSVPAPQEESNPDWSWSTGEEHRKSKEVVEESYEERQKTRAVVMDAEQVANLHTCKEKKGISFSQKEKRKRDFGQASRGKNYVEEEKRLLRDSGIYSGFDT